MKLIKMLFILIMVNYYSFGQKKITKFYYVNNKMSQNGEVLSLGGIQDFYTIRKYQNQFEFKESRLFTGSNDQFISYKIVNDMWYYKAGNKWRLFYNYCKKKGGRIHLSERDYEIVFDKECTIRKRTLHKFFLKPIGVFQSHKLAYYFEPKNGIVIIKGQGNNILIRRDYYANQLTDEEITLL